jgi:hypothetical protein
VQQQDQPRKQIFQGLADVKFDDKTKAAIQQLELWSKRLGNIDKHYKKTDRELKAHVLTNLPMLYEPVKTKLHNILNETSMRQLHWKILNAKQLAMESELEEENDHHALYNYKPYKGNCTMCGKMGHKAEACRDNKGHVECWNCHKKGHYKSYCKETSGGNASHSVGWTGW